MKIYFENRKLSKTLSNEKAISKKYGQTADKIRVRLSEIAAADNLEDLRYVAGKFHELIGDRKGELACSLKDPYRLIFKPVNEPLPINEDGQLVWGNVKEIIIIEIVNYHKEG